MKAIFFVLLIELSCLALFAADSKTSTGPVSPAWNETAAAEYLDSRESWWLKWPQAQRDHATACVSCHTALPYALSRRALRDARRETAPSAVERSMLASVRKRVEQWAAVAPFYTDASAGVRKSIESRGTEAVLNALILSNYDAETGVLSASTKTALAEMWSLQLKSGSAIGAWDWLNFHNAPWESNESQYMGAALAAVAVGIAPANYRSDPAVQENLKALQQYLSENYAAQPLFNQVVALWASAALPGILTSERRASLQDALFSSQQFDGGWSLSALGPWQRHDRTPVETKSDGYATGLIVFALEQAGVSRTQNQIARGLSWLAHNQAPREGLWLAYSLNKQRDLKSDVGRFMSDAATAYAVMALKNSL